MEKRFLLALVLSFMVLFVWQNVIIKHPPVSPLPAVQENAAAPVVAGSATAPSRVEIPPVCVGLAESAFENPDEKVVFVDEQAAVKEVVFKKYNDYVFTLASGLFTGKDQVFVKQPVVNDSVTYSFQDSNKKITKRLDFSKSNYQIGLEITIENTGSSALTYSFPVYCGVINSNVGRYGVNYHDVTVSLKDKLVYPNIGKNADFAEVNFLALRDKYFCCIVQPKSPDYSASVRKASGPESSVSLLSPALEIPAGKSVVQEFTVYLGPQETKRLLAINPDWQSVVYFGKLDFIAHILLSSLRGLHSIFRNWGLAIMITSLLIYLILYPLTVKQLRSMKEMQALQPKIEELRIKYKDDQMRLQRETMALYKEHKINPLGGCLPLILQMPIFLSFYLVLSRSIELRGAHLLWIKDLSEPDKLFVFTNPLPFLGTEFNLLPLLMMGAQFFQQKFSGAQMTGQAAEQQKIMLFVMPVMFAVFFYHMPSGLVLYWFTNTILMASQQAMITRQK
jgi:YidC/Oxa1 family membrane protein insertase